jgi:hypothetical protein
VTAAERLATARHGLTAADPVTALLVQAGRLSQWPAVALGSLTFAGPHPELGPRFAELFVFVAVARREAVLAWVARLLAVRGGKSQECDGKQRAEFSPGQSPYPTLRAGRATS